MDGFQWTTLAAIVAVLGGIGGVLVRLIDRINTAEKKAETAMLKAVAEEIRVGALEQAFNNHRVSVAQTYVSLPMLQNLEGRILDAIEALGIRIDKIADRH